MTEGLEGADEAREVIAKLPGADGWWHEDGEETYPRLLDQLLGHMHPDDAVAVLSAAYGAAAAEFGN